MLMVKLLRINIEKQGLQKFFSPNEVRIMELLWEKEPLTSLDIQNCMDDLSLPCVAGTLDRLTRAEFVRRELNTSKEKVRYTYYASRSRNEVGALISERILDSLVDTFGPVVMDTFGKMQVERAEGDQEDV